MIFIRKILKLSIRTFMVLIGSIIAFLIYYQYNNRLFLIEARIIWPHASLDEKAFRIGRSSDRASMAIDIIENKRYVGAECNSIGESLGEETGDYYISDCNTTYQLTNYGSANWILTFVCGENGTISKVLIHKSCCSVSQKALGWTLDLISPAITWVLK